MSDLCSFSAAEAPTGSTCTAPMFLRADVLALKPEIVANRRWFHAHPELSFKEVKTAERVAELLRSYGIDEVIEHVGRTGVVAIVRGGAGAGPCIALRADMDALPLQETADIPYRSVNANVMHACGHDGHMASLLAAAKLLHATKAALKGVVKLVFQPAEEGLGGAREMILDGVLEEKVGGAGTRVDAIYGIHLWTYQPVGVVSVKSGPMMAASDRFDIDVHGKGGHGAAPQGTVDAIVEAAHLVTALQSVVSRNRDPLDPGVVTVGSIAGGSGYNIICDHVRLTGTMRSFTEDTQELMTRRMHEICAGVAATFGGRIEMTLNRGYPATVNADKEAVALVRRCGAAVVGAERASVECATCGAEDFSYFMQQRPGAFFFVGAALPGEMRPHHKSVFDLDEDSLLVSATMFLLLVDAHCKA